MDQPRKSQKKEPESKPPLSNFPNWAIFIQLLIGLLIVWSWAAAFKSVSARTILYSEFKQHLKNGEVEECTIASDQIAGIIAPKPAKPANPASTPPATSTGAATATAMETSSASATSTATAVAATAQPEAPIPVSAESSAAPAPPPALPFNPLFSPSSATGTATATATATAMDGKPYPFITIPVEDPKLTEELEAAHVKFNGSRPSVIGEVFWTWLVPLGILAAFWMFLSRRMTSAGQSVLSFGKSRARLVGEKTGVTFNDVAGCDEAKYELQEVVDFLTNPARYRALGAKIPKGVLLIGPPGTGKTLLARAVAGEARVPFFSLSGSEFVEMFVGVGASRVRDMFQQAKAKAPCILFIDELDAIGRQRGVHIGVVNDEREQTLNQLLVEMDGFEENIGVILLAATNRPEILDRALLRPGRFDRQVSVDAPDLNGREAVLKVHARNKKLAPSVNLRRLAQATPGLSGADLANVLNEAALLAARRKGSAIEQHDLEEAVEKVVAGPERKTRRLGEQERHRVAHHEAGHALIAAFSAHADPVHKISIVPHGRSALGYTMQFPSEDQFLMSYSELFDRIKGMLGGRAAEDIVYGEVSTGAENDLDRATAMARQMICVYGMSDKIGLARCVKMPGAYLGAAGENMQRDCSEQTAREIDEEVKKMLDRAYADARTMLKAHREQLDLVSSELYQREVLDQQAFYELIKQPAPVEHAVM